MAKSVVAVLRSSPGTVLNDIARLADLAGMSRALDAGVPTVLKDNISWHLPFLSANTTPWQLEGAILACRAGGARDLVAVHNDTVVTDPRRGLTHCRLGPVYRKYDVPEVFICDPGTAWSSYRPRARMRVLDALYAEGIRIPEVMRGKNVVHLPTLKTHIYTGMTGSMKNAFGGLLGTRRYEAHAVIHETLVDLLAIQREIHPGIFTITDGTIAGEGAGPRTMRPREVNLLLASADPVAIDAVAARLMGFDPLSLPFIRLADEAGLGHGRPEALELRGDDVSGLDLRFARGVNLPGAFGRLIWFGPLKRLEHLAFGTPLVHAFIAGSSIYHDLLWWRLAGKPRMAALARTSQWMRLFDSYPE